MQRWFELAVEPRTYFIPILQHSRDLFAGGLGNYSASAGWLALSLFVFTGLLPHFIEFHTNSQVVLLPFKLF